MRRSQGRDHLPQVEEFIDLGFIEEVLGVIKTGKEASVYCCRGGAAAGAGLVAAKVFRARQFRFKNDAVYQQARVRELGLPPRAERALASKSEFGRKIKESTWHHQEYATLKLVYDAGSDVPRPIAAAGDIVLMEYIGDENGPAPQLNQAEISSTAEARRLYAKLIDNIEIWLSINRVHGDLSPHNILYFRDELKVIDFPQATDPRFNPSSQELLVRDVANVCRFFEDLGVETDAWAVADDLWRCFSFGLL